MLPVYTKSQIRDIEAAAIKSGISGDEMMKRAGEAAFVLMREEWPDAKSILVLCGGGNNGGDGYVLALNAYLKAINVRVRYVGDNRKLKGEALHAYEACKKAGVDIKPLDDKEEIEADVIVDALLGIGLEDEPNEEYLHVIQAINDTDVPVFAIDAPSGLIVDAGVAANEAVVADVTITFIGLKQGMLTADGPDYCGELVLEDLDIPKAVFDEIEFAGEVIDIDRFEHWYGERLRGSNKGAYGHVLVVGGADGMQGAAQLAALGAARVGAGLTTVACLGELTDHFVQPEIMVHSVKSKKDLAPLLEKATAVIVGPGLGQSALAKKLLQDVLATNLPLVVDADALNLLSKKPKPRGNWILTPHPGEAARLLAEETAEVQMDRFVAAETLQRELDGVVVLKGCGTIVDAGELMMVCNDGNPGMASGGMGDLLAGIIGGLVAQGAELTIAAAAGVCMHARAGDLASVESGERGLLATDLLPYVRELANTI